MTDRVRLLVADDATLFRNLLERELAQTREVVEGASTLSDVDAAFARCSIDLALIDLAWRNEGPCLPRLKHWCRLQPNCRIVILTSFNEWLHCHGCLEDGAHGVVVKTDPLSTLERAIDAVLGGEQFVSESVIREPVSRHGGAHRTLSPSARRVLELLAEGFTQKEIAITLRLSLRTVEDHVHAIKIYFGIPTRAKPNWVVYFAGLGGEEEENVV